MQESPLLDVQGLVVEFARTGGVVRAVDGLDLRLARGEVVGLAGESGCGKSTAGLALFRLVPPPGRITAGRILFDGTDLLPLPEKDLRRYRGAGLAWIPQEPAEALNPVLTVGSQVVDVIRAHRDVPRRAAWDDAVAALARVGIADPARRAREYPHQYSGGMRQRALIAMALAARPRLLVADEPTTAVDATVQAGIAELLRGLVRDGGLAVLLISHDLDLLAGLCDRVAVMYAGRLVEDAPATALFADPRHPYTRALLTSRPAPDVPRGSLAAIPGSVPDLARLPAGCAFHPRCPWADDACRAAVPPLRARPDGRRTACRLEGDPRLEAAPPPAAGSLA